MSEWVRPEWRGTGRGGEKLRMVAFKSPFRPGQKMKQHLAGSHSWMFAVHCAPKDLGLRVGPTHRRMTRTMDQRKHAGKDDNRTLLFSLQISLEEQLQILWGQINGADRFLQPIYKSLATKVKPFFNLFIKIAYICFIGFEQCKRLLDSQIFTNIYIHF